MEIPYYMTDNCHIRNIRSVNGTFLSEYVTDDDEKQENDVI